MPVSKKILQDVMVRRLKEDIGEIQGGFPKREVFQVDIDGLPDDAPELRLSALLDRYRQLREQRLKGETSRKQAAASLLITGLQQRLLSSIEVFARTLRVHRRTVQRQWDEAHGERVVTTVDRGGGQAESRAMREILETQKKHISETVAKHEREDTRQQLLGFAEEELRQLEANKRYWSKRLVSLAAELETEPVRIRDAYQVRARRIEPVGLVYLWPVTG